MSLFTEIDTALARKAATRWGEWGEQLDRDAEQLDADLDALWLPAAIAGAEVDLRHAAIELYGSSEFIGRLADAVTLIDVATLALPSSVDAIWRHSRRAASLAGGGYYHPAGDLGGSWLPVTRPPWDITGDTPSDRAIATVRQALLDSVDDRVIAHDEFEIVQVGDNEFVLVLAGVTDLSNPDRGFAASSETVRDLDQAALRSATSTSVADNLYALHVREAVRQLLPVGANVAIIGHSYGADTALDLAADDIFNGQLVNVTHVVATGYHTDIQLPDVPQATRVLSLQNTVDLAVFGEVVGGGPNRAVHGRLRMIEGLVARDVGEVVGGARLLAEGASHSLVDVGAAVRETGIDVASLAANEVVDGITFGRWRPFEVDYADLLLPEAGISDDGRHTTVAFDGGFDGYGHHPSNYLEFLDATDLDEVDDFMGSFAEAGYAIGGPARAVDISLSRGRVHRGSDP